MKRLALAVLALAIIVIIPADAQTGVPVKNALVLVSPQENIVLQSILAAGGPPSGVQKALLTAEELLSVSAYSVSTDAFGQFVLNAPINSGIYNVMVFAPGFVASSESFTADSTDPARNLTIFMQPSAMLSGRVVDIQGRPVPGVVVAASSPHSANYDITMDDGIFVLDTGLKTGMHKIYIFKPGINVVELQSLLNSTEFSAFDNRVPAIFQTTPSGYISQVLEVQLEQGKLTTLNVQLQYSHIISGRVTDIAGNPVQDIAVFAFDDSGTMVDTAAITDSDGRYELKNNLAPGKYTIVIPPFFSRNYAPAITTVTVPAESGADFQLDKSGMITGRVSDVAGNPVAGATVSAILKDAGTNSTELLQFLAVSGAAVKTDSNGSFVLDKGIGNGKYIVTASFGSVPVIASVETQASDNPASIALDFSKTIAIKGIVTDISGKGIENASVVPSVTSAIYGAELFAVKTGPDGAYELVIPIKDNSTISLFNEVAVTAKGYERATVQSNTTAKLDGVQAIEITGIVIAQKSLSPPVETVLTRKGTVLFEHEGAQFDIGLQTNTRVIAAEFDPSRKSISLNLEGVQDENGKSEFSIPKDFMSGPFAVMLDGRLLGQSVNTTQNQTHSTIVVEHEHDLKQITIQGATAVPEFPLPAALTAAAVLAAVLVWKRLKL